MDLFVAVAFALCLGVFIGFFWGYECHAKDVADVRKQLGEPE